MSAQLQWLVENDGKAATAPSSSSSSSESKAAGDADVDMGTDGKEASGDATASGDAAASAAGDEAAAATAATSVEAEAPKVVRSYLCTDTGRLFRTMQDAQLYAERTGNANFEESDKEVPPLTEAEKTEKLKQIRDKIAAKKTEREATEKADARAKEMGRRKEGQQVGEMRESYEKMQRDVEFKKRKKEKEDFQKEKERLRRQVATDKAERAADSARRRGETPEQVKAASKAAFDKVMAPKGKAEAAGAAGDGAAAKSGDLTPSQQMDAAIELLQAYRVGGAGAKALNTLKKMLNNLVANPDEDKFKTINLANEAFKKRVASLRGGVAMLKACGFEKDEAAQKLTLKDLDASVLKVAVEKIEKALV